MEDRGVLPINEPERSMFLSPTKNNEHNPELLDHIKEGWDLLSKHLLSGSRIYLIIDPDVDGMTSSALFYLYLRDELASFNFNYTIDYHIPDGKSHGLDSIMEELRNSKKYDLIVLPDSSSNDYEYHKELAEMGYDILVLDHHEADHYSEYATVINNQLSENYPNKALSGVGVVYKFFEYVENQIFSDHPSENYLDLVALGEISDVMNMTTLENRWIVEEGLSHLNNQFFKTLVEKQAFSLKLDSKPLDQVGVAFYITPLINALIRVGNPLEKEILFRAFIEPNTEIPSTKRGEKGMFETVATQAARNCTNAKSRQTKERDKAADLLDIQILENDLNENKILILNADELDVSNTLTGLCAMNVAAKYKKPVLLGRITPDGSELRGSIRNKDGSPIKDLRKFLLESRLMTYVDGHSNAAGFGLPVSDISKLIDYANSELSNIDFSEGAYDVDFIFEGNQVEQIRTAVFDLNGGNKYWGQSNPTPALAVTSIVIPSSQIKIIGQYSDTIKIAYDGIEFVKFKSKAYAEELKEIIAKNVNVSIIIVGKPAINEWMGRVTPQIVIDDMEIREIQNIMEGF